MNYSTRTYNENCFLLDKPRLIEIMNKYGFDELDLTQLSNHLKIVIPHERRNKLRKEAVTAYNSIKASISSVNTLKATEPRLDLDSTINNLQRELKELDSVISTLGLKVDSAQEAKYERQSPNFQIEAAKHKEKMVGFGGGSALIRTKKEFSYKQQNVDELFSLALFWVARKGKIGLTRPDSSTNNSFFDFCSEILAIDGLSASAVFNRFYENYEIEYSYGKLK